MSSNNQIRWYIAQTFSGHEKVVKQDLENRVNSMGMQDFIFRILIPEENVIEKRADGSEKVTVKNLYPGYVFIEMIVTDESWFVVRNTPKVTGFLGSSGRFTKPIPMPREEIDAILIKQGIIQKQTYDNLVGKIVLVKDGVFKGNKGVVLSVDNDKEVAQVSIDLLGRETPTEIEIKDLTDENI